MAKIIRKTRTQRYDGGEVVCETEIKIEGALGVVSFSDGTEVEISDVEAVEGVSPNSWQLDIPIRSVDFETIGKVIEFIALIGPNGEVLLHLVDVFMIFAHAVKGEEQYQTFGCSEVPGLTSSRIR